MDDRRPEIEDWLELLAGLTARYPWLASPPKGASGNDPPSIAETWADLLSYQEEKESTALIARGKSPWLLVDLEAAEPRIGIREGRLDMPDIAREVKFARRERLARVAPPRAPDPGPARPFEAVKDMRSMHANVVATHQLLQEGKLDDGAGLSAREADLIRARARQLLEGDPAELAALWERSILKRGNAMPEADDAQRRCSCGAPKGVRQPWCPGCTERERQMQAHDDERLRRAG